MIGWSRNSNSVTTPKLPPPPRRPQNRSGFSVAVARTIAPSAVTTVYASTLSQARPNWRASQPMPPPSVRPPTPVCETLPAVVASPCGSVAAVEVPQQRAALDPRAPPRPGRRGPRSSASGRSSARPRAPPARGRCGRRTSRAISRPAVAAVADRGRDVVGRGAAGDERRAAGRPSRSRPRDARRTSGRRVDDSPAKSRMGVRVVIGQGSRVSARTRRGRIERLRR